MGQRQAYHFFNSLTTNVSHLVETSQLICITNQLTSFYMVGKIGRLWVKIIDPFYTHVPFLYPLTTSELEVY